MEVKVRLFATLRQYLPEGAEGTMSMNLPEGTTVGDLLARMGIPEETVKLRFVNGSHADVDKVLAHGDEVGLFPPLAGGGPSSLTRQGRKTGIA